MSLRARLAAWVSPSPAATPRAATQQSDGGRLIRTPDDLEQFLREGQGRSASGAVVNTDTAMRVAAVFGCVRIISGAVSTMPLGIKRRVDARTREDVADHPAAAILRRPNHWQTPSAFRRMLTAHVLLRGRGYALKAKDHLGRTRALYPLHPDRVITTQNDDLTLSHRYTRRNGAQIDFRQDDIFYLTGFTLDGFTGLSIIDYARRSIGLAIDAEQHGASVFSNGASVGAALKHPKMLSPEAIGKLQAGIEAYRGSENAFKTLILEEGMDFQQLGMTSQDAQYIETRAFSRGDIAMFFGVPPHMLGDTEKSTSWGSGIEQQSLGFVAYTLQDHLTAWQDTIDRDLLSDAHDLYSRFNPAGLVRGDIKTRYGAYAVGRQWGWLSANDIRGLEDMNPIEGGDLYLTPMNMTPAGDHPQEGPSNVAP